MTAVPNAFGDDAAAAPPEVDPSAAVAKLNTLLRGELSAAETYRSALDRMTAADTVATALQPIAAEHGRSVQSIRGRIEDLGGQPADSSGLWGVWAQTVQSALSLVAGEAGTLRALREGEEHGLRDYESALNEVDAVTAQLIQDRLMPAQQKHLDVLDQLLATEAGR